MSPDDPRHGTIAGHNVHVKHAVPMCEPCKAAKLRYDKRRRHDEANGRVRNVPMWRVERRVHALQRLGWSLAAINAEAGLSPRKLHSALFCSTVIRKANFDAIDAAYDRLSMKIGPTNRARRHAERMGWPPPLAWIDIDDPDERPRITRDRPVPDHVVVDRILAGHNMPATKADRNEVIRRWVADGRPLNELERLTGWNVYRHRREVA